MMTHKTIQAHAVVLTGSTLGLTELQRELGDFKCDHYRNNALLVADVAADELDPLERLAAEYGVRIEQIRGPHEVRVAADETEQPKQPKLDVLAGGWYRSNQDVFPLIHIIEVRNQIASDGVVMWLFDVDLIGQEALPQQATLSAEQLHGYKPKPASLSDFEDLDIVPPAGFEPTPHAIPSVEDNIEDLGKTAGVSLPQALIAAQALQRQLGLSRVKPLVARAPSGGFYVSVTPP